MKRRATAVLCGIASLLTATTSTSASQPVAVPQGTYRLQLIEVIDNNGFERPMVAATTLVPIGWKPRGGVVWNTSAGCGSGYKFDWTATSPDGVSAVSFLPAEAWEMNNMGYQSQTGCPMASITDVQQYLRAFVQRARPGASIIDIRPRPDIARQFEQLNQVTPMASGEFRSWVEAGEVLIAYNMNGRDMREVISSAAVFNLSRFAGVAGGQTMESMSGSTFTSFSMRAPNGELDFQLAEAIRKSGRPAPEWLARITTHNAKMNNIARKGIKDRAEITRKSNEEIRRMQQDSWRSYNESSDHIQRETTESIRGVETYDDPYNGGTVELDNTYEYAWQLSDGSYVVTDDASFQPYAVFGQDGQQLEATK